MLSDPFPQLSIPARFRLLRVISFITQVWPEAAGTAGDLDACLDLFVQPHWKQLVQSSFLALEAEESES